MQGVRLTPQRRIHHQLDSSLSVAASLVASVSVSEPPIFAQSGAYALYVEQPPSAKNDAKIAALITVFFISETS
jgi:hypothetical protein